MQFEKLKLAYVNQLIQLGYDPCRSMQVSKKLTMKDYQLISEIWSDWDKLSENVNSVSDNTVQT